MTRQTRSAYGCIEKAGANRWRVRWWGDRHDGRGYRRLSKTIHGSRRDARLFLSQMETAHHDDKPMITVGEVFERWYWPEASRSLSPNSVRIYLSAWRTAREKWGDHAITDIDPVEVQEWLLTLSQSRTKGVLDVLKPLMDHPAVISSVPVNPFRLRYRTNKNAERRDKGIYTLDECARLADAAEGSFMRCAVILAAFGSCRTGESLAVTDADVSRVVASNGMVCAVACIDKQVDAGGNVQHRVKNRQSAREVVIPHPWSAALLEAAEVRRADGGGLLTHDGLGGGVRARPRTTEWKRIVGAAGLPYHQITNLRNSWRTYMEWTLGVDRLKLERLMGHAAKDVSEEYYNRPLTSDLVNVVAEAFAPVGTA